jgi:hypothetical protein
MAQLPLAPMHARALLGVRFWRSLWREEMMSVVAMMLSVENGSAVWDGGVVLCVVRCGQVRCGDGTFGGGVLCTVFCGDVQWGEWSVVCACV